MGNGLETYYKTETRSNAYNTTDRLHTGKEFHAFDGLSWHDNAARFHDTLFPRFTTVDPLAEKDPGTSPYAYCGNNPLRFIDPSGESTQVVQNKDGSYTIKSVNINDSDLGVYVVGTEDEEPRLIGYTATITSFYDTGKDKGAAVGSVINPNDKSGINFLKGIVSKDYTLGEYAGLARKEGPLDFKYSNGDGSELRDKDFRGMPISSVNGLPVFTSARDVGNIAAGYVAARNGLSWEETRLGFDIYQNLCDSKKIADDITSQNAQRLGFNIGINFSNGKMDTLKSIPQFSIVNRVLNILKGK